MKSLFQGEKIDFWLSFLTAFILTTTQLHAAPITIICSTDNPEDSLHVVALQKFDELVRQYSEGQILAVIHYRGNEEYPAIRGEEVNANMVKYGKGGVDATVIATGNISQTAQILNFLMLPYIFPDIDAAQRLLQSDYVLNDVNEIIAEKHGVRVLGWLIGGFRHMTNSKRPVTRLEDMHGLTIRTPRNRLMRDTYLAFGAQVDPINWEDTFSALKEGTVDGQENPYSVILYSEFWKANQRYVTNNGPFLWTGPILINEAFYQKLSPALRRAVSRAGLEASMYQWAWIEQKNEEHKKALIEKGMQILDLVDQQKWIDVARPLWDAYLRNIGYGDEAQGKAVIERILTIVGK